MARKKKNDPQEVLASIKDFIKKNGREEKGMFVFDKEPVIVQDICVDGAVVDKDNVLKYGNFRDGEWTFYRDETNTKVCYLKDSLSWMEKMQNKKAKS